MAMMVGGDLSQLQRLEQQLGTESQTVGELQARLTSALGNTTWTGPAADRFRNDWATTFSRALQQLQHALADNAAVVRSRRVAIEQATS